MAGSGFALGRAYGANCNPSTVGAAHTEEFQCLHGDAEAAMEQTLGDGSPFLWLDVNSERAQQVRGGQVVAQFWSGHGPVKVPNGLIHDWIGASFIPGTTVEDVLALVQDYDNHKNIYKPEVIASRLVSPSA
jgi:hypothetical protein